MPNAKKFLKDGLILDLIFGAILLGLAIEVAIQWFTNTILIMGFVDFLLLLIIGLYLISTAIRKSK